MTRPGIEPGIVRSSVRRSPNWVVAAWESKKVIVIIVCFLDQICFQQLDRSRLDVFAWISASYMMSFEERAIVEGRGNVACLCIHPACNGVLFLLRRIYATCSKWRWIGKSQKHSLCPKLCLPIECSLVVETICPSLRHAFVTHDCSKRMLYQPSLGGHAKEHICICHRKKFQKKTFNSTERFHNRFDFANERDLKGFAKHPSPLSQHFNSFRSLSKIHLPALI